jgi:hypothetical protein
MFCASHRPPYEPEARARLQVMVETALVVVRVPPHLHDGLVRYLCDGILPGSFLQAALADDFTLAAARADPVSLEGLVRLRIFLSLLPASCWGSADRLLAYTTTPNRLEV